MKLNDKPRLLLQKVAGQLTNKEYTRHASQGTVCPYCKHDGCLSFVEDEDWESYRNTFYVVFRTQCDHCGKEWRDAFKLAGYIEDGEDPNHLLSTTKDD